ncbi:MAG: hypothetical protein OEW18_00980 [Candidatus Aminicenantes bacterium]|nr:hypothetical protein [Candidatus Aminicenantes bacterium]
MKRLMPSVCSFIILLLVLAYSRIIGSSEIKMKAFEGTTHLVNRLEPAPRPLKNTRLRLFLRNRRADSIYSFSDNTEKEEIEVRTDGEGEFVLPNKYLELEDIDINQGK